RYAVVIPVMPPPITRMSTEMSLFSVGNDLIRAVSSQYEVDLILNSSFATRRLAFNKNRFGASANMQISLARRGLREGMPLQRWSSGAMGYWICLAPPLFITPATSSLAQISRAPDHRPVACAPS